MQGEPGNELKTSRGALAAGGLAAILASTCCLGPLVLVALGVSGAWIGNLTALEPYRPVFPAWRSSHCYLPDAASSVRHTPASPARCARYRRCAPSTSSFSGSSLP